MLFRSGVIAVVVGSVEVIATVDSRMVDAVRVKGAGVISVATAVHVGMLDVATSATINDSNIVAFGHNRAPAVDIVVNAHAVPVDGTNLTIGAEAGCAAAMESNGAARTASGATATGYGSATVAAYTSAIADSATIAADIAAIPFAAVATSVASVALAAIACVTGPSAIAAFVTGGSAWASARAVSLTAAAALACASCVARAVTVSLAATVGLPATVGLTAAVRLAATVSLTAPVSLATAVALAAAVRRRLRFGLVLVGCHRRNRHQGQC